MHKNKLIPAIGFLLILITLIAYREVGDFGFVKFDDNVYITQNLHVQNGITVQGLYWAFTTGYAANWHPLTWISHMLDIQLFGLKAQGHHLTNLLFHALNVLLLFFALRRMTKTLWQSAFVAALFALHPLHVESVAWISERKDVLSTFFWMLTLIAYSYYAEQPRPRTYLAVFAFLALGLMAKPMLVTLPFVLLLFDYWPLERFGKTVSAGMIQAEAVNPVATRRKKGKTAKQPPKTTVDMEKPATHEFHWALLRPLFLEKIPLFALTTLSCAATYIAQNRAGAVAPIEIYALDVRLANALVSYFIYFSKTIWPDNLAVFYPHPGSFPLWQVLGAVLFLTAATFAVIRAAGRFPYLPVGWLWFAGTLVPVIGIVQVGGQAMADRYTYIPSIGLFIMAAWGIPEFFKKRRYGKEVLAAVSASCLLCLLVLTTIQAGYWRDSITLFDHALKVTEKNYFIHNNRGGIYDDSGNYGQAIADFDRAIEINPIFAPAYNNRGNALDCLGDHTRAIRDFDKAIEIKPEYAEAYSNRGIAYRAVGNYTRAIEDLDRAIAINPEYALAYNNRGVSYAALGNQARAVEDFNRAVAINPKYAKAYFNRAIAYRELGNQFQAIQDLDRAIEINPGDASAYYHRGIMHTSLGNQRQGLDDLKTAARFGYRNAVELLKRQGGD
jgi:protein O-mannosyl-transferase